MTRLSDLDLSETLARNSHVRLARESRLSSAGIGKARLETEKPAVEPVSANEGAKKPQKYRNVRVEVDGRKFASLPAGMECI